MPSLPFVTVDVFTTTRFAGNPLAIVRVPKNHEINTEQMQTIAREFNLSETVFLHETSNPDSKIPEYNFRIFLTQVEVPFAGHPTIGTSCYAFGTLANNAPQGRLICNAGPIDVNFANNVARARIPHNVRVHSQYPVTLEDVYTIQPALRNNKVEPKAINLVSPVRGMDFICVELPNLEALAQVDVSGIKPSPRRDDDWTVGFLGTYWYVVTTAPVGGDGDEAVKVGLRTRMLDPTFEDPATGSAACGLTSMLAMKWRVGRRLKFEITQAVEMGRQSDIGVEVTLKEGLDAVEAVELSGSSVKVMEGVVEYD